jgi:hypothetical protein
LVEWVLAATNFFLRSTACRISRAIQALRGENAQKVTGVADSRGEVLF